MVIEELVTWIKDDEKTGEAEEESSTDDDESSHKQGQSMKKWRRGCRSKGIMKERRGTPKHFSPNVFGGT